MRRRGSLEKLTADAVWGDQNAQLRLGVCYSEGKGVAQDQRHGWGWLLVAARQGNAEAQFRLGLYREEHAVRQSYPYLVAEAAKWYEKAAEQGHAQAQNNLGMCHVRGRGMRQDYGTAFKWLGEAAAQGHDEAKRNIFNLARQCTTLPKYLQKQVFAALTRPKARREARYEKRAEAL